MVVDIQGSGYTLYNPEIASKEAHDEKGNHLFCSGNLSHQAIDGFLVQSFFETLQYCDEWRKFT